MREHVIAIKQLFSLRLQSGADLQQVSSSTLKVNIETDGRVSVDSRGEESKHT